MPCDAKTVLVVDDEAKIVEVLKSFLESKGFTVFCAENGKQALEVFECENISIILLDLMLPDLSGQEICAKIRQKSSVPIIMLTAKIEESDMLEGLGLGADDFITKPFSLKALLARIEAVLRRSTDSFKLSAKKSRFNGGELEVDFDSHTVSKNGVLISLTRNEFKIFSIMIKHANKVFTRDDLIQAALGDEFDGYDRAVDSHIKNIRQKLENDPKNPSYVLTVYGVGYKFGGQLE